MTESITDIVGRVIARRNTILEEICEAAAQSGELGVLVIDPTLDPVISMDTAHDRVSVTGTYSVELSTLVPYGHVFQFPSRDAVKRWVENGRPS
jgi:hypothetical protein